MDREAAVIRSEMSQTRRDLDYKLSRLGERAREMSPRRVVQRNMPDYLLELLSGFDHIFLGLRDCVDEVARITGRPCSYLPLASDVLRFAPRESDQPRPIEVCNIGRRSQVTHHALLEDSARRGSFYYYDTVAASGTDLKQRTFRVESPREHRTMLAPLLPNSR